MPAWVARCGLEARAPRAGAGSFTNTTQASRISFNDPTLGAWSCRAANSGATNSRVLIMQVDDEDVGEERCLPPGSAGILPAWVARCGLEARAPRRVQGPSQTPLRRPERTLTTRRLAARSCRAANSGGTNSRVLIMQVDDEDVGEERCLSPGSAGILPAWVAVAGWKPALPGRVRVLHKHPLRRPERTLTTRRLAHGHAAPRTPARRTAVSSSCRLMTRTLVKSDVFLLGVQASCLHGSPVAGWKPALSGGCRVLHKHHSGVQNVL